MSRLPRRCEVEVTVAARPEAVWAVLANVTPTGEWSHECHGARWLDGPDRAAPGVRFRGRRGRLPRWRSRAAGPRPGRLTAQFVRLGCRPRGRGRRSRGGCGRLECRGVAGRRGRRA
ncbi:SRPBCC family protein [Frankia sp. AiPa1]|uniref:SRPBCC family protein n=1 Tax=Frankia sp. AiPa1 TaxID=573492 RepID=UPI0035A846F4